MCWQRSRKKCHLSSVNTSIFYLIHNKNVAKICNIIFFIAAICFLIVFQFNVFSDGNLINFVFLDFMHLSEVFQCCSAVTNCNKHEVGNRFSHDSSSLHIVFQIEKIAIKLYFIYYIVVQIKKTEQIWDFWILCGEKCDDLYVFSVTETVLVYKIVATQNGGYKQWFDAISKLKLKLNSSS